MSCTQSSANSLRKDPLTARSTRTWSVMVRAHCVGFCLLLAVGYSFAASDVITPEKCGGDFKEVRVNPCTQLPCNFERGKSVGIEVDFTPEANFDRLQATFKGELTPGTWLPLPGFKKNACAKSGLECPLEAGKQYTFSKQISVLPSFPTLEIKAEVRLKAGNGTTIFCFYVPVKIV
ncbi:NPC intracellular cholesterol transporter 2 isoform X4 [Rhipicephalus sanguineus]|uniref:NPC intracellular cholesterol transporter 2 isoform X4 n=1 Tax=Rhipicephalus sanguineus TaxID=34632 RepID=UPI001895C8CA|nr:NPC intracellular cholesterol transporter 2 isoform X4 [Rhipicephalus sanguineus]